jgi:hypothetical protein
MTQLDIEGSKGGSNGIDATIAPTLEKHYVFGRKEYPKPLEYVGTVSGEELDTLGQDKQAWVELVAFPEAAVIYVIGDKAGDGIAGVQAE